MAIVKSTISINAGQDIPRTLNFSRTSSASRVNALGRVETVAAGQIRLDFDPTVVGQQKGWLLEETSTNLFLNSADFGTTWTAAGVGTVQINQAKSPDGSTDSKTGDLLKASSGGDQNVAIAQAGLTFTSGSKYTVSVWAKKGELDYLEISDKLDATDVTYAKAFKLSDGTLGNGTADDATIEQYPNGWYRCTVSFTANANTGGSVFLKARSDNAVSSTCNIPNANDSICLWGAQVEALPYATSYIPTTTAPVARAADVAYIQETDPCWNWDVGASILIHGAPLHTTGSNNPIYHYQDAGNNNFISYLNTGDVKIFANGTSQLDTSGPDHVFDTGFDNTAKAHFCNAIAITKNRVHMGHNGSLSPNLPDTSVTVPMNTDSSVYTIKFFHGEGMNSSSGWLKRFEIWSNILSDASLKTDTINGSLEADPAVQYNPIEELSVTTGKIAPDAVTGDKIADNSIGTEHLKVDIILAEDIAANAIGIAEIQNSAVTSDKIADNAVNGAKIALGSDAEGDIMYYNGTNYVRLPKGTNGHVLTLDTGLPSWKQDATDVTGASLGGVLGGTIANATINNGVITTDKLDANAVDDTKIADNAIKSEHYTDLSILTAHIGNLQITDSKIAANTVTGAKILSDAANDANRAITTNHIKDGNITRAKLGANVIDGTKLADNAVDSEHYVDLSIDTAHIGDLQVTEGKLADSAITSVKISNLQVTEEKIATGAITNGKLGADAVNGDKIADDAINSEHYVDGSINTAHIGDLQVTAGKIANNTITATQIANTTITSGQLAANAVTAGKILDGAVGGVKIAMGSDAQGDIMYHNGTSYVRLAAGTAGQVLTTGGAGANPSWAADSTNVGNTAVGGDVTGTVSNITIPANSITSAMIAPGVIVAQDIATNAVNGTHLAMGSDAAGDTLYYNGTDYVRLAKGTAGQVLTMNSGATAPEWAADSTNVGTTAVGGDVTGTVANIQIPNNAITSAMLGVDVIVAEDIAANAITVAELNDNAVATAKIQDLAITSAKIADDAVEMTKLNASGTASNTTFLRGDGVWATPAGITSESDPTAVTMAIALG